MRPAWLAILAGRSNPSDAVLFTIGQRQTAHIRHWHKYSAGQPSPGRRFNFQRDWDTATRATAGSITELEDGLRVCDDAMIIHHCRDGDLSRWIARVPGDPPLAAAVKKIETAVQAGTASITEARTQLTEAIHARYHE